MEAFYLKGYSREWHSDEIILNQYFERYTNSISRIIPVNGKSSLHDLLKSIHPSNLILSKKELKQLHSITNVNQLKVVVDPTGNNKKLLKNVKDASLVYKIRAQTQNRLQRKEVEITEHLNNLQMENLNAANEMEDSNVDIMLQNSTININSKINMHSLNAENRESTTGKHQMRIDKSENLYSNLGNEINEPQELQQSLHETSLKVINSRGLGKVFKNNNCIRTGRHELLLDERAINKKVNLYKGKDFVVSFRIHEPFGHNDDSKPENFLQEIHLLGHHTLEYLRDKIICESDFQDIQGDLSENPDTPVCQMARDMYKSAMFYFDNTFYIDSRCQRNVDYSTVIKQWATPRGIAIGNTHDMSHKMVSQLKIRFGYPYLYMHQGCCEHLVIINDARLLSGKDSLYDLDYPRMSRIHRHLTQFCMVCLFQPAWWIVASSDRLIHDVTFMCKTCFKMYNYSNGKKCGKFKAYRYFQKNVLL